MKEIANVLLVDPKGRLLMQHRDDKPGLSNSGKITAFGGALKPGETPLNAAIRELKEETGLSVPKNTLKFFKTYQKTKAIHGDDDLVHLFILNNVDKKKITVYEGQGLFIVSPSDDIEKINFSVLAGQFVNEVLRK